MKKYKSGSACEIIIEKEKKRIIKKAHYLNNGIENGHDKLLNEIYYLQQMNKECNYFPKILDYYYKDDFLCAKIEYLYDGETLSDIICDDSIDIEYLNKSLDKIFIDLFKNFYIRYDTEINRNYLQEFYINRTIRRMKKTLELINEKYTNMVKLKNCIENGIVINGISYKSVFEYMDYLTKNNEYINKIQPLYTYRTHHDLIPDNIIIEKGKECIERFKLIDPRGESETGKENRHYLYDIGKMIFGLDGFRLFRQAYHNNDFTEFKFKNNYDNDYSLLFNSKSKTVKKLINLQERMNFLYNELLNLESGKKEQYSEMQLLFSASFMYIPDVPCRLIDEGIEDLCILFYARGCMFLHELLLKIYGKDQLSSDIDGKLYKRWELF